MRLEVRAREILERLRHPPVEQLPPRNEQRAVRHFPDAVVREVESLPHAVEHAAAHELFEPARGVALVEIARPMQEGELEFAADDGGDGGERPSPLGEPRQPAAHDVADALGQAAGAGCRRAFARREHRLDRGEGIAAAHGPGLIAEPRQRGRVAARARDGPRQLVRFGL